MIVRKIGERFYDCSVQLQVEEDKYKELDIQPCIGCYYLTSLNSCNCNRMIAGSCISVFRQDGKNVRFVEV